ncbi:MAG: hypothetical protein IT374_25625 [Polyangiaceae bacterium]|nr:hypothetical protein [Polyangiaceae bacterium]
MTLATPARIPNELRSVVFVAARGTVGKTELGEFQRSLPAGDWLYATELSTHGWARLKPVLAWTNVILPSSRGVPLREILGAALRGQLRGFHGGEGLLADVDRLLETEWPELDHVLQVPYTEVGVRLSRSRSHKMRETYEAALRLCAHTCERERLGHHIDFDAAVAALREALASQRPLALFEAVEHGGVLRALLAGLAATQLRGDEVDVVYGAQDEPQVHRVYIKSRLPLAELAAALRVPRRWLRRSDHGIATRTYAPAHVEQKLRRAAAVAGPPRGPGGEARPRGARDR